MKRAYQAKRRLQKISATVHQLSFRATVIKTKGEKQVDRRGVPAAARWTAGEAAGDEVVGVEATCNKK